MNQVKIYCIEGDPCLHLCNLLKQKGYNVIVVACPLMLLDSFEMPFLRICGGDLRFGTDAIKDFVRHMSPQPRRECTHNKRLSMKNPLARLNWQDEVERLLNRLHRINKACFACSCDDPHYDSLDNRRVAVERALRKLGRYPRTRHSIHNERKVK